MHEAEWCDPVTEAHRPYEPRGNKDHREGTKEVNPLFRLCKPQEDFQARQSGPYPLWFDHFTPVAIDRESAPKVLLNEGVSLLQGRR